MMCRNHFSNYSKHVAMAFKYISANMKTSRPRPLSLFISARKVKILSLMGSVRFMSYLNYS